MRVGSAFRALRAWGLAAMCVAMAVPATAEVTSSQRRAAEEYLGALASGDTRAMAFAIHEEELQLLRQRLLDEMRLEADRNENLIRGRLFGVGMPLADIERLTVHNFFVQLASRLRFAGRSFDRVEWLDAVNDSGSMVHLVGRLRPLREHGEVRVPVLVTLVPWGKDWKAALPLELQAQIDDLRAGRTRAPAPTQSVAGAAAAPAPAPARQEAPSSPQGILELFATARANLEAGRCEDFYERQMSPNFRRTTAARALRTLVQTCESRPETRERILSALEFAGQGAPRFEYGGTRAVYDLRGKGLPFQQLVVEQVDKRWYIAD